MMRADLLVVVLALPSGQGPESGDGVVPERVYPRGKAVYWLPEGPKLVF